MKLLNSLHHKVKLYRRSLKHYYQRLKYGISFQDSWDLWDYLLDVIDRGLENLGSPMGYPHSLTPEKWDAILALMREQIAIGRDLDDGWYEVDSKALLLPNTQKEPDIGYMYTKEELKLLERQFQHGMKLLTKWFFNLWD